MCENLHVFSIRDCTPITRTAEIFYLDIIDFRYAVEIPLHEYTGGQLAYRQREAEWEIKRRLQDFISTFVESSIEMRQDGNRITGKINVPYYNEEVISQRLEQNYKEKLEKLAEENRLLKSKIEAYNELPWYKRIWRKI